MADTLTDRNGVRWTVIVGGTGVFATPDPASPIRYDPEPADLGPVYAHGGDAPGAKERAELAQLVNAWAGQHAKEVALVVTAGRGGPWVLLLVGALLYAASRKRRR